MCSGTVKYTAGGICKGNAPVICNDGYPRVLEVPGMAGLKYLEFSVGLSWKCRGCAGLLISAKYSQGNSYVFTGQYQVIGPGFCHVSAGFHFSRDAHIVVF